MDYQKVIEYKIKALIDLMMTDGVSPSELSSNIFEENYISISFSKRDDYIIGKIVFYENEELLQNIQMIYTYTKERRLVKIEEKVNDLVHLLWDRQSREEDLIQELLFFMNKSYDTSQIKRFIMTLPEGLKEKVIAYEKLLIA